MTTTRLLPVLAAGFMVAPMLAFGQGTATPPAATRPPAAQASPPDGTPGNPPSTALGRAVDRATGQPTSPDGTGNNPPGTALGRAMERAGDAVGGDRAQAAAGEIRPSERVSRIIGADVYNERGENIGEVEDIVLAAAAGQPPMAVISVGGFLGIGARMVGVPLSELRYAADDRRWTLSGATKETLQNRPVVTFASRG